MAMKDMMSMRVDDKDPVSPYKYYVLRDGMMIL
jgi:hypothetical protein